MPLEQEKTKVKQKKTKVKQKKHKVKVEEAKVKEKKNGRFSDLVARITAASIILLIIVGCSNYKVTTPDGVVHLFQRIGLEGSAKRIEFYYNDPNDCTVWLIVNDPNSTVNPANITIKEPNTGIEGSIEAK